MANWDGDDLASRCDCSKRTIPIAAFEGVDAIARQTPLSIATPTSSVPFAKPANGVSASSGSE